MCTVLLPQVVNQIAVNKYIISSYINIFILNKNVNIYVKNSKWFSSGIQNLQYYMITKPWSTAVFELLIVSQLHKKFPEFYGI